MLLGIVSRFIRVRSDREMRYKLWTAPAHTAISMSVWQLGYDPERFPAPDEFLPECWLYDTIDELDIFSSSRGLRVFGGEVSKPVTFSVFFAPREGYAESLSHSLAQTELYLMTARIFGQFNLELFQTTRSYIEAVCHGFVPVTRRASKGIRYIVR